MTTEPATAIENSPPKRAGSQGASTTALTKSATVIKLLLRARGATPVELTAATEWQPPSVRAFLSGLRKQGRSIVREPRKTGEFAYRIATATVETAAPPAMCANQSEA